MSSTAARISQSSPAGLRGRPGLFWSVGLFPTDPFSIPDHPPPRILCSLGCYHRFPISPSTGQMKDVGKRGRCWGSGRDAEAPGIPGSAKSSGDTEPVGERLAGDRASGTRSQATGVPGCNPLAGRGGVIGVERLAARDHLAADSGFPNHSTSVVRAAKGGAKQVQLPRRPGPGLAIFEISQWKAGEGRTWHAAGGGVRRDSSLCLSVPAGPRAAGRAGSLRSTL